MMTGHLYVGGADTIDVTITGLDSTFTNDLGYDLYVYYRSGGGASPILTQSWTTRRHPWPAG